MTDFHVYQSSTQTTIVMDPQDPQREEILKAISSIMNSHDRAREADECLDAIGWTGAV